MKNALLLIAATMALGLTGCTGEEGKRNEREIETKGYLEVGKTPAGQSIYMMPVRVTRENAWYEDRVYFIGNTTTAIENCGKGCSRSVVTTKLD